MQEFEVIFYDKPDGTEPVKEFLNSLDVKMRAKMLRTVLLLAENGTQLREPYSKPLDDGIFELRAKVRNGYLPCTVFLHDREKGDLD